MPKFLIPLLTALCLSLPASAQITSLTNPLPQEARALLEQARTVAADALEVYSAHKPDQPLFREAIMLGRQAAELAPENPEALRFLAELYGVTDFYGPAYTTWQRYVAAGGTLDTNAARQLARNGNRVGYDRYSQGDLGGALEVYQKVARQAPDNGRAQRWSGRILLEQDKPKAALPYWRRVQKLQPDDPGASYFLSLAQAGVTYGMEAARAFYGGVTAYESGQKEAARRLFARSSRLSPDYAAAWGYLGRVAFESGQFGRAETAYARASALEPQNGTFSYFLRQAQAER